MCWHGEATRARERVLRFDRNSLPKHCVFSRLSFVAFSWADCRSVGLILISCLQTDAYQLQTGRQTRHFEPATIPRRPIQSSRHARRRCSGSRQVGPYASSFPRLPLKPDFRPIWLCTLSRSVSSLSFYGSAVMGTGGARWDAENGQRPGSPFSAHDLQSNVMMHDGKTSGGNLKPHAVKPYTGEVLQSVASTHFGITTPFHHTAFGASSQTGVRNTPAIHSLWPESKKSKQKEGHFARRQKSKQETEMGGADREAEGSPDSQGSPPPMAASPSWTEKPRIGYLFRIEDNGTLSGGRFGGAPQLTTKISDHRMPTPSRFRTAGAHLSTDQEGEVAPDVGSDPKASRHGSPHNESSSAGHCGMTTVSPARADSPNNVHVTSPVTARRNRVSMHASVDLLLRPQRPQREVWVAPESPDVAKRPESMASSVNPLQFVAVRPTQKDNVKIFHRSFL